MGGRQESTQGGSYLAKKAMASIPYVPDAQHEDPSPRPTRLARKRIVIPRLAKTRVDQSKLIMA
jgi:hypothetical protein